MTYWYGGVGGEQVSTRSMFMLFYLPTTPFQVCGNHTKADAIELGLTSNPEGPLDSHVEELAKKKYKNVAGELKDA
jgi:hypothetical protein